ncbi:MAG: ABC transporter permease [Phycisphaeraceae bacterium]|jgi:tungstate transport system permease protein|nr:ABC transporter permease [Phycisphaeraceae bacterium]
MHLLWDGLIEASKTVAAFDPLVMHAALRTLWVSGLAVTLAALVGVPLGTMLARVRFPGRQFVVVICRGSMALPTVFVGLVCYSLFSRGGPLGMMQLIYTPWVIVAGELLLALPITVSITHGAVMALDRRVGETAWTLGAGPLRRWRTFISEARVGVTLAILTAFARCASELGIAMMVGGNIKGRTRTLATATALETGKGELARAMAMGILLTVIALLVTIVIVSLSRENRE